MLKEQACPSHIPKFVKELLSYKSNASNNYPSENPQNSRFNKASKGIGISDKLKLMLM